MSYIPYPFFADTMPVDLSFIYKDEKPAGKHGFLKPAGSHFAFEDGTVGRFWGVNVNGGACFPEHSYSEIFASRMAKIGCNIVRFHQIDAEWNTPNIFSFAKGERVATTRVLDERSLDRLDYLVYCLKEQGIYCYLDMFTYRKFKSGDGVVNAHLLKDAAKPYATYNRHLIELQKELASQLWGHFNKYTGLKYCDDPVFVMAEITNENDVCSSKIEVEPYVGEFRSLFRKWLDESKIEYDAENCDVNDTKSEVLLAFKQKLTEDYYKEMYAYMREIGVKLPITGTNWVVNNAITKAQQVTDYTDSHVYLYDWQWKEFEHRCLNKSMTQTEDDTFGWLSLMRSSDVPFFVSEWDVPWPNEYRSESSLLFAAVGSFQGWSGFAIHTYAYGTRLNENLPLGKEIYSGSIGGVPYREGIFSVWNDPAKLGLFYHAALITRRQDVAEGTGWSKLGLKSLDKIPVDATKSAPEVMRIACDFSGKEEGTCGEGEMMVDREKKEVISSNKALYRNWDKNYGYIDTERTKCAYGFLGKNGKIEITDMSVECKTDYATIALSSLTNDGINCSDNMLLTTVGRAKNSGAVFDGELMARRGNAPILVEVIEAEITLKTKTEGLKVWAISPEGLYIGQAKSFYDDNGDFHIVLGETMQSMYYLVVKE